MKSSILERYFVSPRWENCDRGNDEINIDTHCRLISIDVRAAENSFPRHFVKSVQSILNVTFVGKDRTTSFEEPLLKRGDFNLN